MRVLEARAPQTLVELLGVASLDLVGEQAVEELGVEGRRRRPGGCAEAEVAGEAELLSSGPSVRLIAHLHGRVDEPTRVLAKRGALRTPCGTTAFRERLAIERARGSS
ncbi:MAG: hypothetical protein H6719_28160 [Sandaracinaceae bacterium]|nr:hypothetical protein [Sandaracinaceae bacterium]